jgi:hypothetical protein
MRTHRRIARTTVLTLTCTALSAGVSLAGAGVAAAANPTTGLVAVQAKASADITLRLAALNRAVPQVNANAVITAADKSTLLSTLHADVSGLTALGGRIAADTTTVAAQADAKTIFTTYRVFALAIPQVAYAAAADDVTGAELPPLVNSRQALTAVLKAVPAKNTPAVQAAMADLAKQIATISSSTDGLSGTVLAFTPAQYDADHDLLSGPRKTLATAQADVIVAKNDVVTVTGTLS